MAGSCRIVVMASGNGSNFQALIDAVKTRRISNSHIVRLFVDRKKAYAATRADDAGIPCTYFNVITEGFQAKGEKNPEKLEEARAKYDAALAKIVLQDNPDLIILAGWMHVFTYAPAVKRIRGLNVAVADVGDSSSFLQPMRENHICVINLHPALPGTYEGTNAIERAYKDFQEGKLEKNRTGLMIHYVIEEVDRGEPILVQEIQCREGEDLRQLEERFHAQEHELIVNATAKVASILLADKGPGNTE